MSENTIENKVLDWWKELMGMIESEDNTLKKADAGRSGERAELRRCKTPQQVMLCKGYHRLRAAIGDDKFNPETLAVIAGLCSHIRNINTVTDFPKLLATPEKENSTPPLSEARFRKILTSRSPEEFYTQLRRAIHIVNNTGYIPSIVKGIILWYKQRNNSIRNIQDTMLFQWSKSYYDEILVKEKNNTKGK